MDLLQVKNWTYNNHFGYFVSKLPIKQSLNGSVVFLLLLETLDSFWIFTVKFTVMLSAVLCACFDSLSVRNTN